MYQIFGTFLMYKEGQAICKFIAETYGEEKILQLIDNIWKSENFSEVMEITLGVNYRKFDERWLYHLKKEKYPLMEDSDAPGMITKHVTNKGINTKPVFATCEGQRQVVFISNRMGYSNIYRLPYGDEHGEKNHLETLIEGERTSEFESFNLLRSKMDVDKQGRLVFVSKSEGKGALYIYSLIDKSILSRHQFDELVTLDSPNWSPGGDRIAFAGINFGGARDLYILDLDTKNLQKLTNDFYDDRDPSWSPDGKIIAFSSDRTEFGKDGAYNLFFYNLETGEIDYVTYGPHRDYTPSWSPDGKSLAFTSDRDNAFNVWLLQTSRGDLPFTRVASSKFPIPPQNPPPNGQIAKTDYPYSISGNQHQIANSLLSYAPAPAYPHAINGAAELRKLTSFTTGAFDPEWTDNGSLLFTAFENFGFQIRELKNVQEFFNNSTLSVVDTIRAKSDLWTVPKLEGEMAPTTVGYKRKFSLDIAQSQITQDPIFGAAGGAQLAMSDMLGNQQYYFLIFNNAQSRDEFLRSFNFAVTRVDLARRANNAFGIYHFAGRYYNRAEGFFYERRYGGFAGISYPLSVFRRLEASLNVRQSDKEWEGTFHPRRALLVSNFVSYVKDNSLWGPSGPLDGERFNFSLGYTIDVQHSNVNFYTIIADYRRYFRTSLRTAYALRLTARINHGKEAFPFFMGGSWDLRLYPRWQLWGQKTLLLSNEFRFPAIDQFAIAFPFGGLGFNAIRGALFVDAGNAWDNRLDDLLGSMGFGIRVRVGGFLVLRYDIGKRFTWFNVDDGLSLSGLKLYRRTHHQFFFGWDF
jgi:dipeptidyl aminopeptidase/acylaminoacyl peptidase